MADEAPTTTPDEPKTSRVEHVRIGEGDKVTGKKLPPWAIAGIVGGVALIAYYIYKKRKESSTSTGLEGTTGASNEGFPGYGYGPGYGGYGTGNNETNGSLLAQLKKWEEEQETARKKWEEEHKPPPPGTTTTEPKNEPPGKTPPPGVVGNPPAGTSHLIPEGSPTTYGPEGGNTLTQNPTEIAAGEKSRAEYQREHEQYTAPAVSPQVNNPPQPAPSYIQEAGKAVTSGFGTTGGITACPATFPLRSTRGCYRPIRLQNGCEGHEYKNGTIESQHKVSGKCVW